MFLSSRPLPTILFIIALLVAAGCGGDEEPAPGGGRAGRPGHGKGQPGMSPGGAPPMPAAAVAVRPARVGSISSYYAANATLDPKKEAEVPGRVSGVVTELFVEEGDLVKKGESLLQIEDREYRHRLTSAEAEAAKQQARYDRLKKMFEGDLISAEEFEGAKSDLQSAEANRGLAELQLSYTRVRSPFNGRVVERFVDPGETVGDGTPLFRVADVRTLLARVHVPAREFRAIQTDQTVELTVGSSDERLQGKIILISPIVDPNSGTIKVTVEIDSYPGTIRPGDFAEVRIVTDLHENSVLVPKTAVISDRGEQVVFVAADSVAVRRPVETGFVDDRSAEITAGLAEGETVVVQGQRSLRDGQPLRIMEPVNFEEADRKREES